MANKVDISKTDLENKVQMMSDHGWELIEVVNGSYNNIKSSKE